MFDFISLIWAFWKSIWLKLETAYFSFSGESVSLASVIVAFLIVGMALAVFWKGAKT